MRKYYVNFMTVFLTFCNVKKPRGRGKPEPPISVRCLPGGKSHARDGISVGEGKGVDKTVKHRLPPLRGRAAAFMICTYYLMMHKKMQEIVDANDQGLVRTSVNISMDIKFFEREREGELF